jgi:hypothetical protein
MLVFTTHNYFLFTRKEVWFYDGEPLQEGTYNAFSAAKRPYPGASCFFEKYPTSIIALDKPEEELFNAIHSTYRYDIRSAEKNKIEYLSVCTPSINECQNLVTGYNLFANEKKLPTLNLKRILAMQQSGNLCITKAMLDGIEICTHIYLFDRNTVSLTQSFNNVNFTISKIRSEANKWLHWKDILFFKNKDIKTYDFGGLNPKKLPGVNKFKINFGGNTIENYRFIRSSKIVFFILKIIKKTNTA